MRFSLDFTDEDHLIRSYREGCVVVGERELRQSVLVGAGRIDPWAPQDFDQLEERHFAAIAEREPELVIVGTGARQRFPHPRLTRPLLERGIGVEIMDTGAACRTYNVILAEGRRVVAALIMIRETNEVSDR